MDYNKAQTTVSHALQHVARDLHTFMIKTKNKV